MEQEETCNTQIYAPRQKHLQITLQVALTDSVNAECKGRQVLKKNQKKISLLTGFKKCQCRWMVISLYFLSRIHQWRAYAADYNRRITFHNI